MKRREPPLIKNHCGDFLPPRGCPLIYPRDPLRLSDLLEPVVLKVETHTYFAVSEGQKRKYTNRNGLKKYGEQKILSPEEFSYCNLFINGVLQPPIIYEVKEGVLYLKSSDLPAKGAPIILQFVAFIGTL